MVFTLNELTMVYPEQIWIEFSPEEKEKAWLISARHLYSNASARWTAFLNCLCLNTLIEWLQDDPDFQEKLKVWPSHADLPSFWEVVNGTALTLDETRLVVLPSDKSDLPEFRIPQEWVDIPNWTAYYYLPVQLNLTENWLRVWGYATYEQVRAEADYDERDRTYSVNREGLIEDLNVLWVARSLYPNKQPEGKPLLGLSTQQTEKLLAQLSQYTPYSPRLDVPFEMWAALLASADNRKELYRRRLACSQVNVVGDDKVGANNLSQWFQQVFDRGWQSVESMLYPKQMILAAQFRSDSGLHKVNVKGAKLIDLGMHLRGQAVVLLVGLNREEDDKVSIRVQVYPAHEETYLPPNLKLALLSASGQSLQDAKSRCQDNYIQLKRFRFRSGAKFTLQVALGDVSIREDFVLEPLSANCHE
ncbi:DUF1822 family protein [Scytonema sp. NUACC26]|uniref:DUF1822 family protein n=1 Tax=Scytonema sp. NUACC26 TaxID=3140176 RepID=UPI0038B3011F